MRYYKINEYPPQVNGEPWSETVIGYDSDLEYTDLVYYDYEENVWKPLGGLQMELIAWTYIPSIRHLDLTEFETILTE